MVAKERRITLTRNKQGTIDIRIFDEAQQQGVTLTEDEAMKLMDAIFAVVERGDHRARVDYQG